MTDLVFVYGTLRGGGSNHWRMENATSIGTAKILGMLFRVDHYPALIPDDTQGAVTGEVYRTDSDLLGRLDDYEGDQYTRVLHRVTLEDAAQIEVWLWRWNRPMAGLERIPGGDWLEAAGG
ncbi:MAG: gamma-glutamylcyclotransferase family protein [Verrucomicrobiota bacterium]